MTKGIQLANLANVFSVTDYKLFIWSFLFKSFAPRRNRLEIEAVKSGRATAPN